MSNQQNQETGFTRPRNPKDGWARELNQKYDLPADASLEQVETVAKTLLANPLTMIEGAELVLGRRIDAKEFANDDGESMLPLVAQLRTGKDRFGALLMQSDVERRKAESE